LAVAVLLLPCLTPTAKAWPPWQERPAKETNSLDKAARSSGNCQSRWANNAVPIRRARPVLQHQPPCGRSSCHLDPSAAPSITGSDPYPPVPITRASALPRDRLFDRDRSVSELRAHSKRQTDSRCCSARSTRARARARRHSLTAHSSAQSYKRQQWRSASRQGTRRSISQ
jgi:hypothetical protein